VVILSPGKSTCFWKESISRRTGEFNKLLIKAENWENSTYLSFDFYPDAGYPLRV